VLSFAIFLTNILLLTIVLFIYDYSKRYRKRDAHYNKELSWYFCDNAEVFKIAIIVRYIKYRMSTTLDASRADNAKIIQKQNIANNGWTGITTEIVGRGMSILESVISDITPARIFTTTNDVYS
jgi:hypothetical protein